jgi:hypothetical protein
MEGKAIQNIVSEDFIGYWESSDKSIKLFVDKKGYLTIDEQTYEGALSVEYLKDYKECTHCLRLTIGEYPFYIKQIGQNGFFLSIETGEIFLTKLS